jgi:hypothetical protein
VENCNEKFRESLRVSGKNFPTAFDLLFTSPFSKNISLEKVTAEKQTGGGAGTFSTCCFPFKRECLIK